MRVVSALLILCLPAMLVGCENANPTATAVTKAKPLDRAAFTRIMEPCGIQLAQDMGRLMELANAGAEGQPYSDQAKKIALACGTAHSELARQGAPPSCLSSAGDLEVFAWALNSKFVGKEVNEYGLPSMDGFTRHSAECAQEIDHAQLKAPGRKPDKAS